MREAEPRMFAPVCPSHIGGILGERIFRTFVYKGGLSRGGETVTGKGLPGLEKLGISVERLSTGRRKRVSACVELHGGRLYPHIGSHLGSPLVDVLVERCCWCRKVVTSTERARADAAWQV